MATGVRRLEIFVRNAQEEYITTVELQSAAGRNAQPSSPCATDAIPSRCVVEDYTRDSSVMGTRVGDAGAVTMISVRDADKLKGFRSYLSERKKAGVVKLSGGGRFFLLPATADTRLVQGESIVGLVQASAGGGSGGSAVPAASAPQQSPLSRPPPLQSFSAAHRNSNSSHARPPAPPPALPAEHGSRAVPPPPPPRPTVAGKSGGDSGGGDGKKPEPALGGFLGSLMGSMSQTHKSVAGAAAVDRANRAQEQAIRQRVSNFEAEVRDKIEAFSTDPGAISHTFPHVEKSLRSIQHSLAEEVDGVTTRTEGELDDRRVVLYKLGYEPPEEEVQVDAQVHLGLATNTTSSSSSVSAAPMPPLLGGKTGGEGTGGVEGGDLVRIGTVVKDRRTVQDIEEESRKRRRGC
ncbi:unnamed protein product [Scytosiphon promiscuus]